MDDILIRKANIEDLKSIQELNNDLFNLEIDNYDPTLVKDWPYSKEGYEYFYNIIKDEYVIVAVKSNEVIGYLAGGIKEKGSYTNIQYGEIENMLVKGEYRKLGIGRMLINNFKEYCKSNKINNIKVVASYKNKNAIKFYHINGFEEFEVTLTPKI